MLRISEVIPANAGIQREKSSYGKDIQNFANNESSILRTFILQLFWPVHDEKS